METDPLRPPSPTQAPPPPPQIRRGPGRPPGKKSSGSSPSRIGNKPGETDPAEEVKKPPSSSRLAAVKELAKNSGDVVTCAMTLTVDLEDRKKAALGLAAKAGTAKLADLFVRVEPYAEWVALGIAAVTYVCLLGEGLVRNWLNPPPQKTPAPPPEKLPDNGKPRPPGGSQDDVSL